MLINYIKIAFRNILREKIYTTINVMGLAIGIAASIVILMHIRSETGYEKHFKDADRIYRVGVGFMNLGTFANAPEHLKDVLDETGTGIELSTRIRRSSNIKINNDSEQFIGTTVFNVDSNYFDLFSHKFVEGDQATVLSNPNSIVLSLETAQTIFGENPAIGKYLTIGKERQQVVVTGVIDQSLDKTQLKSDVWLPIYPLLTGSTNWTSAAFYTYFKAHEDQSREGIDNLFEQLRKNEVFPTVNTNQEFDEWKTGENAFHFNITPLTDIHFNSDLSFELAAGGNINIIYVFSLVAILILATAAINFINLTTARSARRAREVGIRKTFGTSRSMLIQQFLLESISLSLIAMVFSFGLVEFFLLAFEEVTGYALVGTLESRVSLIYMTIGISILVGFLAGIYPSFYLTSFKPVDVLKTSVTPGGSTLGRNILVAFQFTISIVLIISSLFIYYQLDFLKNKDLGFNDDRVVVVNNVYELDQNQDAFKNTFENKSYVENSSLMERLPAGNTMMVTAYKSEYMNESKNLNVFSGDHDMISTLGIDLVYGREFSKEIASDSNTVLINESATSELLLPMDPVGEVLNGNLTIVGVIKDFNFESLERNIEPAVIRLADDGYRMAIKVSPGYEKQLVDDLNKEWLKYQPEEPLDYYFLESNFIEMLENDEMTARAIALFTGLAIFISCLGLFGLAAYTSEKRSKEIGIRKVLGASLGNINYILLSGFVKPVLFSFIVAGPAAYLIVKWWLQNFAYQVSLSWYVFAIAFLVITLLSMLTVIYYAISLSRRNPIVSLKEE